MIPNEVVMRELKLIEIPLWDIMITDTLSAEEKVLFVKDFLCHMEFHNLKDASGVVIAKPIDEKTKIFYLTIETALMKGEPDYYERISHFYFIYVSSSDTLWVLDVDKIPIVIITEVQLKNIRTLVERVLNGLDKYYQKKLMEEVVKSPFSEEDIEKLLWKLFGIS